MDVVLVDVVVEAKKLVFVVVEELDIPREANDEEEPTELVEIEVLDEELAVLVEVGLPTRNEDVLVAASVTEAPILVVDVDAIVFEIVGSVNCTSDCDVGLGSEGRPPVD